MLFFHRGVLSFQTLILFRRFFPMTRFLKDSTTAVEYTRYIDCTKKTWDHNAVKNGMYIPCRLHSLPRQVLCPRRTCLKSLGALSDLPPGTRLPNSASRRTFRASFFDYLRNSFSFFRKSHPAQLSSHRIQGKKRHTSCFFKEPTKSREMGIQNSSHNRKAVKTERDSPSHTDFKMKARISFHQTRKQKNK